MRLSQERVKRLHRFIPTCVGNTNFPTSHAWDSRVYPHARGEYLRPSIKGLEVGQLRLGLPGAAAEQLFFRHQSRSPAGTGDSKVFEPPMDDYFEGAVRQKVRPTVLMFKVHRRFIP